MSLGGRNCFIYCCDHCEVITAIQKTYLTELQNAQLSQRKRATLHVPCMGVFLTIKKSTKYVHQINPQNITLTKTTFSFSCKFHYVIKT